METKCTLKQRRPRGPRRWLALCVAAGALLPIDGGAQGPTVVTLKSALHTVAAGNFLVLTTTEVGAPTSTSAVTIEILDAADRRRAFTSGTLQRAKPVRLRMLIPAAADMEQFRAVVTFRPLTNAIGSEPMAGLEEIDVQSFQVVTKGGVCPVMMVDNDSSVGGNAEGNCGGWRLTRAAL